MIKQIAYGKGDSDRSGAQKVAEKGILTLRGFLGQKRFFKPVEAGKGPKYQKAFLNSYLGTRKPKLISIAWNK